MPKGNEWHLVINKKGNKNGANQYEQGNAKIIRNKEEKYTECVL